MSEVNIVENFLTADELKFVKEGVKELPWNLQDRVSGPYDERVTCDEKFDWQMVHMFYDHPFVISNHMNLLQPILDKINPVSLYRAKLNLNPVTNEIIEHGYHSDYDHSEYGKHFTSAVFYLNTNNGYTKFENGQTVMSKENTLVTFPSLMKHTGSTCTDVKYRQVLNLIFIQGDSIA